MYKRQALDLLHSYDGPELLIYADPPYVRSTRTLNGDQYAYEMTDADHVAMLQAMAASHSMILLSGYCLLYTSLWKGDRNSGGRFYDHCRSEQKI